MATIIDFTSRKAEKEEIEKTEKVIRNSYLGKNSIVLKMEGDEEVELVICLDIDQEQKITIDDRIDEKNLLVNIFLCDEDYDTEDDMSDGEMLFKPRFGDVMNSILARVYKYYEIKDAVIFLYEMEVLDEDDENNNSYIMYYTVTTDKNEIPH